ncbi:MAG: L-fuculose phosphate aldolase, partial [uncultured Thermomicrobiales bacterium]
GRDGGRGPGSRVSRGTEQIRPEDRRPGARGRAGRQYQRPGRGRNLHLPQRLPAGRDRRGCMGRGRPRNGPAGPRPPAVLRDRDAPGDLPAAAGRAGSGPHPSADGDRGHRRRTRRDPVHVPGPGRHRRRGCLPRLHRALFPRTRGRGRGSLPATGRRRVAAPQPWARDDRRQPAGGLLPDRGRRGRGPGFLDRLDHRPTPLPLRGGGSAGRGPGGGKVPAVAAPRGRSVV